MANKTVPSNRAGKKASRHRSGPPEGAHAAEPVPDQRRGPKRRPRVGPDDIFVIASIAVVVIVSFRDKVAGIALAPWVIFLSFFMDLMDEGNGDSSR